MIKTNRFHTTVQSLVKVGTTSKRSFSYSLTLRDAQQESAIKPDSLRIKNPRMRAAVIEGYGNLTGPPSLKSRSSRVRYTTPNGLDDVFPLAYKIVQEHQNKLREKARKLQQQIDNESKDDSEAVIALKNELEKTLIEAEIDNPEVQYNFTIGQADLSIPVYRYLAKQKWSDRELLVLMQRLETLSVIPDTEPTLDPKVQVQLQFPGSQNKWVEPGAILPCAVAIHPPHLVVQEFENTSGNGLYTVLIVDPDTPDLDNDSYNTTLHWALSNIPLSINDSFVNPEKSTELISYLPPTPSKNSGTHRYAVWVYRQSDKIDPTAIPNGLITREKFDIRNTSKMLNLQPVGAHLWRSHFDRTTQEVLDKYGLNLGPVFTRTRK